MKAFSQMSGHLHSSKYLKASNFGSQKGRKYSVEKAQRNAYKKYRSNGRKFDEEKGWKWQIFIDAKKFGENWQRKVSRWYTLKANFIRVICKAQSGILQLHMHDAPRQNT